MPAENREVLIQLPATDFRAEIRLLKEIANVFDPPVSISIARFICLLPRDVKKRN